MKEKIAFASDYDNTLFMHGFFRRGISKKDRDAIEAFQQEGGLFGLCTGRPYHGFAEDKKLKRMRIDFYIASTGAHILDGSGKVLFEKSVPHDVASEIFTVGAEALRHSVQVDGDFFLFGSKWKGKVPRIYSLDEIKGRSLYEFSFHLPNEERAAALTALINEKYGDTVTAFQNRIDIDIVAAGCSKGTGARFIKEHFGLDVVCGMGDSLNDEPLVTDSDIGFTFPSAPAALKDSSDRLAKSVGDAIAQVMRMERQQ